MALRGCAQPVQRVGGAGYRRVKAEGERRGFEIIVYGLGYADNRNAMFKELLRRRQ